MRVVGLILTLLGGVTLAYSGLTVGLGGDPGPSAVNPHAPLPSLPVTAGIAFTSGLLLVAVSGGRRGAA